MVKMELSQGSGQWAGYPGQVVVVQIQPLQVPQLGENLPAHLITGDLVAMESNPEQPSGIVEDTLLDGRDLVVLEVDILHAGGDKGQVLEIAVVAVHGCGEVGGTVALLGAVSGLWWGWRAIGISWTFLSPVGVRLIRLIGVRVVGIVIGGLLVAEELKPPVRVFLILGPGEGAEPCQQQDGSPLHFVFLQEGRKIEESGVKETPGSQRGRRGES